MHGEDDDACGRQEPADLLRRLNAIQFRHGNVHDDDIGFQLPRLLYRFPPRHRFPDHLDVSLCFQEETQTVKDDAMVIGKKNRNAHRFTSTLI